MDWLRGRLVRRAKDLRQAEEYCRQLSFSAGYPYAATLADVHARAASVYEEAALAATKVEV